MALDSSQEGEEEEERKNRCARDLEFGVRVDAMASFVNQQMSSSNGDLKKREKKNCHLRAVTV